jgi:hypothetical protein
LRRRLATWLVVTAACALAPPQAAPGVHAGATADDRLVPQQGIAGVRLGMTQAQVRAIVGAPRRAERGATEIAPYLTWHYRTYTVTFVGGRGARVTGMETRSRAERTATGVGVGSTRREVVAGIRGARCLREFGYDHCYVGRWVPGGRITDLALRNGRVTRVYVGFVID